MKRNLYPFAAAFLLLAAASCEKNGIDPNIPDDQKESITFSMSDGSNAGPATKAGFTGADTRIVARFQSDEKGTSNVRYTRTVLKAAKDNTGGTDDFSLVTYYTTDNTRYWDDAFGRKGQISVYAVAIPNSTSDSKLTDAKLGGGATWATETTPNNSIQWDVTYGTQTTTTLADEDLVYSNNIQSTGKNGRYVWDFTTNPEGYPANNGKADGHNDGCLVFTQKSGAQASDAGHFDKGHLVFNHALSRLTITLVEGTGFDKTTANKDNDFKFTNSANIKLLSMPYTGTLNIKEGSWGSISPKDIEKLISSSTTANKADETFSAQMLPGKVFGANSAANVMQFVIDDNTYYITEKMVYDALTTGSWFTDASDEAKAAAGYNAGTSVTMTQGHNYTLTITVNKTGISNVTATLAPWVEVAGSMTVNNAHISLTLNTSGTTCNKDIDLYRLVDNNDSYDTDQYVFNYEGKRWFGNYSTDSKYKTTLEHSALANGKWTTPWYFESNKEYYHFRTVNKGTTIKGNTDDTNDYFEISAGPQASTDPHWGAPMKSSTGTTWLQYDIANGYEAHLHYAIGATESQIAIQELHMMSNINVILETPSDGGKVMLYDATNQVGTIIKITRLAKNGTVEMGRGLVTPTAPTGSGDDTWAKADVTMTAPANTSAADYFTTTGVTNGTQSKTYTYAVVPQSLSRDFTSEDDDDYVGIFIQTPDHNQYYVVKKLSEIYATTVSNTRDQAQYNESGTDAEKEASKIKRWYPGHTYTYTFTITKKGIENITCTVADWVTVTGKDTPIDLES